jgi:hypothetical protein
LGDGGQTTVSFATPISNGPGNDFAVFENAFTSGSPPADVFAELGFIAVSSDGVNFFTFPSVSLTQTTTQIGGFGTTDPTDVHNLAGKDLTGNGTGFDLSDLLPQAQANPLLLNLNDITEVRVTDVVGDINPLYATHDSQGNIINDPWPTPFARSGFDLDAVGVINTPEPSLIAAPLVSLCLCIRRRRGN